MALQDPEFDTFKRAYLEEDFAGALASLKKLLAAYPHSFALRWHHAKVLERLERFTEAQSVVDRILKARSDFVPALILQVQLDFHQGIDENDDETRFTLIEQRLFKILSVDPDSVDALHMLSGLLRGHAGDAHLAKANQLLERALSLAPHRVDLLEDRANSFLASAQDDRNIHDDSDTITTFSGIHYHRLPLERALADFQQCYAVSHQHRYGLRVGAILHDLGRFDEALATYDQVLAYVPEDDPYRPLIIERRARSENGGASEREHMAKLLESAVATGGKDRTLDENNVAQVLLNAAKAVRGGKSVGDALDERLSNEPDDNLATTIAAQILNVANEPHPDLVEVNPNDYPLYQQNFNAKCKRDLNALGLTHVCDAEAKGMGLMLGRNVLLSFFADESGETGVVCFCLKPHKPSPTALLLLLFTGKWKTLASTTKTTRMVECVSQFANGDYLSTQYQSPSPFEYAPPIHIEKLPPKSSPTELIIRHRERFVEYKQEFPHAKALRTLDLAGMEERWVKGQAVKRAYRKQIGFITDSELRSLLGTHYAKYAEKVKGKVARLAADL